MRQLTIDIERWPIAGVFRISRGSRTEAETLTVTLAAKGRSGRGECVPYARYGESLDSVRTQIEAIRPEIEAGVSREGVRALLPAGAARNAVDCALWDLEAKITARPVAVRAGVTLPESLVTAYTLSLDTAEAMGRAAAEAAARPLLKLKLGGDSADLDRVAAVREAAPEARLIVDANEAWSPDGLEENLAAMAALGVALVEQPLAAGSDDALGDVAHPVPVCADESCHTADDLEDLRGRYDAVNIKLDKTGGLSEALVAERRARELGFSVMVGCMLATSLAMAPAYLVAARADFVDLDGPLLLARDRVPAFRFEGSRMFAPETALWG